MACIHQMDRFLVGQIWGLHQAGVPQETIRSKVQKADGSRPSVRTIQRVVQKKIASPKWRGGREAGSGRPGGLNPEQKKKVAAIVFKHRGKSVVTAQFIKKMCPFLRRFSRQTNGELGGDASDIR